MKKYVGAMIIVLMLVGLSCTKEAQNESENTATVTGYVYLSDTIPAPGVHVYDKVNPSYSGYTDRSGFFRVDVPIGERTIVIDGGIFKSETSVSLSRGDVKEIYSSSNPLILVNNTKFKIAVMIGAFDSIQAVFDQIGIRRISSPDDTASGYIVYDFGSFPTDIETLKKFNLLAFNCGITAPGINSSTLKEYVQDGGNIYASDWQIWVMDSLSLLGRKIFLISDDGDYATGNHGTVKAEVVDNVLRNQLGKDSVTIVFDHDGWVVIDSVKQDVKVLLKADVSNSQGPVSDAPLAILAKPFNSGGMLFYTSFHYEAQATSEDVIEMLRMFLLRIGQN